MLLGMVVAYDPMQERVALMEYREALQVVNFHGAWDRSVATGRVSNRECHRLRRGD